MQRCPRILLGAFAPMAVADAQWDARQGLVVSHGRDTFTEALMATLCVDFKLTGDVSVGRFVSEEERLRRQLDAMSKLSRRRRKPRFLIVEVHGNRNLWEGDNEESYRILKEMQNGVPQVATKVLMSCMTSKRTKEQLPEWKVSPDRVVNWIPWGYQIWEGKGTLSLTDHCYETQNDLSIYYEGHNDVSGYYRDAWRDATPDDDVKKTSMHLLVDRFTFTQKTTKKTLPAFRDLVPFRKDVDKSIIFKDVRLPLFCGAGAKDFRKLFDEHTRFDSLGFLSSRDDVADRLVWILDEKYSCLYQTETINRLEQLYESGGELTADQNISLGKLQRWKETARDFYAVREHIIHVFETMGKMFDWAINGSLCLGREDKQEEAKGMAYLWIKNERCLNALVHNARLVVDPKIKRDVNEINALVQCPGTKGFPYELEASQPRRLLDQNRARRLRQSCSCGVCKSHEDSYLEQTGMVGNDNFGRSQEDSYLEQEVMVGNDHDTAIPIQHHGRRRRDGFLVPEPPSHGPSGDWTEGVCPFVTDNDIVVISAVPMCLVLAFCCLKGCGKRCNDDTTEGQDSNKHGSELPDNDDSSITPDTEISDKSCSASSCKKR